MSKEEKEARENRDLDKSKRKIEGLNEEKKELNNSIKSLNQKDENNTKRSLKQGDSKKFKAKKEHINLLKINKIYIYIFIIFAIALILLLELKQKGIIGNTDVLKEKYAATTTDSTTGAEISDAKPIFSTFKPTDTAPTSTATVDSVTLTLQQVDKSCSGLNTSKTVYRKSENSDMSSPSDWQSSNVFGSLSTAKTYYFQSQVTDNCGNTTTSQIKSQTTIAKSVTVYFHPNGGNGTDGQAQTFTYGVANQKFAAKNFSRTWIESKYSNTDHRVDLYATWNTIQYSIGYNLNGGSISGQPTSYNVTNDFYIPNPSRSGYTFTGWSGTYSGTNLHITAGHTGNISLIANWKTTLIAGWDYCPYCGSSNVMEVRPAVGGYRMRCRNCNKTWMYYTNTQTWKS